MQSTVSKDREKYIGGSDIPIIMELSPFKSRYDLLLEKAGLKENEFTGNVFTEYGNIMEGKIRDYINSQRDADMQYKEGKHICKIPDEWTKNKAGMKIRCHTDGECDLSILEVKTTSQIHDDLDDYKIYIVQLLFYMIIKNKKFGKLAVYERPDDKSEELNIELLHEYDLNINAYQPLVCEIKKAVVRFLDDLQKVKSNPFITEEELLPAEIPDIASRIVAFEQQISMMKEVEKKVKAEMERLKNAMENAGASILRGRIHNASTRGL